MNYELAKKLKDAGWVQRKHGDFLMIDYYEHKDESGKIATVGDIITNPTLSELISATPKLESIIRRGNEEGDEWEVRSKDARYNASSIEEAIAKLWLTER